MKDDLSNFLNELVDLLMEDAIKYKKNSKKDSKLDAGCRMGYYFSISKIFNMAEAWGISYYLPKKWRDYDLEELL